jgi:hypothetical protein
MTKCANTHLSQIVTPAVKLPASVGGATHCTETVVFTAFDEAHPLTKAVQSIIITIPIVQVIMDVLIIRSIMFQTLRVNKKAGSPRL